jgi:hypothetical protein
MQLPAASASVLYVMLPWSRTCFKPTSTCTAALFDHLEAVFFPADPCGVCVLQVALTWQRARQMQEEDITLTGKVESMNRGGVMVIVCNLRGFVPSSHITQVMLLL